MKPLTKFATRVLILLAIAASASADQPQEKYVACYWLTSTNGNAPTVEPIPCALGEKLIRQGDSEPE